MSLSTSDLSSIAIVGAYAALAVMTWALARTRATLAATRAAMPTDTVARLDKIRSDLDTTQALADIGSKDLAMVKASMRSSSSAARQLATELERGLR